MTTPLPSDALVAQTTLSSLGIFLLVVVCMRDHRHMSVLFGYKINSMRPLFWEQF